MENTFMDLAQNWSTDPASGRCQAPLGCPTTRCDDDDDIDDDDDDVDADVDDVANDDGNADDDGHRHRHHHHHYYHHQSGFGSERDLEPIGPACPPCLRAKMALPCRRATMAQLA